MATRSNDSNCRGDWTAEARGRSSTRWTTTLLALLLLVGCEKPLTPAEKAAKDRAECQALATQQSGFDPLTAEEPPRTISSTQRRGGEVVGSGAIVGGAAKGAVVGVVGGAVMGNPGGGAAAGAAVGGLMGGARRHRETNEMVTKTRTNPDYEQFMAKKSTFKTAFDGCLAQRAAGEAR
jgi:hypothetical protein